MNYGGSVLYPRYGASGLYAASELQRVPWATYDRGMPRGEPKVMFSVRLPENLRDRVVLAAEEADESRADLVERAIEAELERMEGRG